MACGCHDKKDGEGLGIAIAIIVITVLLTGFILANRLSSSRECSMGEFIALGFTGLVVFGVVSAVVVGVIAAIIEGMSGE